MIWQLYCCLTSLYVYRQINSYQPPSGYLSIIWSASGGSARDLRRQQAQGVPSPQKVASLRPRASGLLGFAQKLRVLFGGPKLRSSVRLRRTRHYAKKQALRRPERCAAPVQPCLSLPEPPPRRENRSGFPGSQVFGPGTLPVGFQGRSALVAEGEIPESLRGSYAREEVISSPP